MQINANITGIEYQILLATELQKIESKDFDINTCPSSCIFIDKNISFAISKWVSPKRTRSYPYQRVYDTLINGKRITVIPIIKDEGFDGDRDFIQWDTISLMSLLDVYVILSYYQKAEKSKKYNDKITHQQFENQYILSKINDISNYHSSALHWNLRELNDNFSEIIVKVKENYQKISEKTKVQLHSEKGIDNFQEMIGKSAKEFMEFSRQKAKYAQEREFVTIQPNESLQTLTKSKITITNYLGGQYFLTVDEIKIEENDVFLIEGKHSNTSILPNKSDIKDGLLKMILYSNLKNTEVNDIQKKTIPVLLLTSVKLKSEINSNEEQTNIDNFFVLNQIKKIQKEFIITLFKEAKTNEFLVILRKG